MMTKEAVLSEIRRLAQERDGRVGLRAFLKATGIPEKQCLGKYWATWNEALIEAGIETASFARPRTPEESVLEALAQLISRLNKWPSENELSLARRRDESFPSLKVVRRLRSAGNLPSKVVEHCAHRADLVAVRAIAAHRASAQTLARPTRNCWRDDRAQREYDIEPIVAMAEFAHLRLWRP